MKTIITVIGKDKPGIIAQVSTELYRLNINILDVSQTIMNDYFTMVMYVDLSKAATPFEKVKSELVAKGEEIGVKLSIQREEIFDAMRSI